MNLIRKLLSIIFFAISLLSVLFAVSFLSSDSISSDGKMLGSIIFIFFGILLFLVAKWLWHSPIRKEQISSSAAQNPITAIPNPSTESGQTFQLEEKDQANFAKIQNSVPNRTQDSISTDSKISQSNTWQIDETPRFPRNLILFREYDGMKALVTFLFLLSVCNFLSFYIPHKNWLNRIPLLGSAVGTADFCLHLFPLVCCYCLAWVTFDAGNFYGYAMGAFTIIFGLIYMISPLDFSPDFIPVLGQMDDAFVGGASMLLGTRSWFQAKEQDQSHKLAMDALRDGDHKTALKLLLSGRGVNIK